MARRPQDIGLGMSGNRRGFFVMHHVTMLTSPAWRELSYAARRALDRLEVEHLSHGAKENGNLICTKTDFVKWGINHKYVAGALK
jgi:hypothetical protein